MAEEAEETHDFSLEDWVAFKKDIFEEDDEKSQLNVMIGWNDTENKVAVSVSEKQRRGSDVKSKIHASLFSMRALEGAHSVLLALHPNLVPFPTDLFPKPKKNLFFRTVEDPLDVSRICNEIQAYLTAAFEECGRKTVFSVLFNEQEALGNTEESKIDLKVKGLENVVQEAHQELEEVLKLKEACQTMLETSSVYVLEEIAVQKIIAELGNLYNLQLSQFLDEQEFSEGSIQNLEAKLKNPVDPGPETRKELEEELERHHELRLVAGEAIQQLYQEYFRLTTQLLQDQLDRVLQDQTKFGPGAFRLQGLDRLLDLRVKVNEERLKLINVVKVTRELQRNNLKKQIAKKRPSVGFQESLFELELSCCQVQLELLEQQEAVLKAKKAVIEKSILDQEEEGIFFDAPETSEECESIHPTQPLTKTHPELLKIQEKLNSVFRKRATVRNKKKKLMAEKQSRIKNEKQRVQTYKKHHSIQIKRDEHKKEAEEKKHFLETERTKALERLRTYRKKCESKDRHLTSLVDEEGQELPPPPRGSTWKAARSQNRPLPPPPLEFFINHTPGIDDSIMPDSATSSVWGVLPPVNQFPKQQWQRNLQTDLPLPVPFSTDSSSTPASVLGNGLPPLKAPKKDQVKVEELPPQKPNLADILAARSKLKKVSETSNEGPKGTESTDLNFLLRSMVTRIRPNISDSDSEDNESNFSEFD